MTARRTFVALLFLLIVAGTAGCLSYSFGDAEYTDGELHVQVLNSNEPERVAIQVTIFETTDFQQTEIFKKVAFFDLEQGSNEYVLPVDLEPGTYKVYLYILVDGKRTNLEIRDLEV